MHAYRLINLVLLFVLFSTNTPIHAQENVTCPGFQASRLTIGGQGQVTPGSSNNLRSEPARTADKSGEIPGGGRFTVLDGPVCADGTAWWHVNYQGLSGWTVEGMDSEYWLEPIEVCESNLIVGEPAEHMKYGRGQIFEQSPYGGAVLGEIPEWTIFDVIGGPVCADGEVWVEVDYEGVRGWFVEVALDMCDAYCSGEPYLNARLPLLPLETAVPVPGANPLSPQQIGSLPPDAITAANAAQLTTLKILGDGFIRDYAWSPDATQLAVAGTVEVRIYETHRLTAPPRILTGFTGVVSDVLFSPDARFLVTSDLTGDVQVWDTETYDLLYMLDHGESAFEAVFNPDGSLLVTGGNQFVSLWEIDGSQEPQLRHRFETGNSGNRRPDSLVFVSGKDELLDIRSNNVNVHHLITGETRQLMDDLAFSAGINTWAMSPNGEYVSIIGGERIGDTRTAHWYFGFSLDIGTGERVPLLDDSIIQSNGTQISSLQLNYSPDGSLLLTAEDQQQLQGYRMQTEGFFDLHGVTDAEFSPDGKLIAFSLNTGEIRLFSGTQPVKVLYGISGAASGLTFSPDGSYLTAAGSDGTLRVWNVETDQRLGTVSFVRFPNKFWLTSDQASLIADQKPWDIASGQQSAAIALPEGSRIFQSGDDGHLLLRSEGGIAEYDPETAETLLEVPFRWDYYSFPTISWDRKRLAYIELNDLDSSLGIVNVVDLDDGSVIRTFQRQFDDPWGMFLSPDGKLLILSDTGPSTSEERDYRLLVWDVDTGNLLIVISTPDLISSTDLIFSPDGARIAWKSRSGANIYDLANQTMTPTQEVEGFVWYNEPGFDFNGDGSIIALGDRSGDIHLFNTSTGEKVVTLKGHISNVWQLTFSDDGRRLYSTADEGLLRIWGVP